MNGLQTWTLAFVAACATSVYAQGPAIDAVRARQLELEDALVHADIAKLDRMLTSDFVRTPPGGRDTDKAAYSELLRSGQLKYMSFDDREPKYRAYGDTVLVNVLSHLRTRSGTGPERESNLKLLWVWVKRDGQWLLAAVEGTDAATTAR
jgi:ketosteroid isomerase-like protein